MNRREFAIEYLMYTLEGEFAEDEHGGPTYWGIAEKQSRSMFERSTELDTGRQLVWPPTQSTAKRFYEAWWERNYCDLLPPLVAEMWFWFTVHIGEPRARRTLQHLLSENLETVNLKPDGVIGPKTRRAMVEAHVRGDTFIRSFRYGIIQWYQTNLPGWEGYRRRLYPEN